MSISHEVQFRPFLFPDEGRIPSASPYEAISNFANAYRSSRHARTQLVEMHASRLLQNPNLLKVMMDQFVVMSLMFDDLDSQSIQEGIIREAEQRIPINFNPRKWGSSRLMQLVQVSTDYSDLYRQESERLQAAVFNAPNNTEQGVDVFYGAAWAMIRTPSLAARRDLYSTINLEKDWLQPDSNGARHFLAGFYSEDDDHLAKFHAILTATEHMARLIGTKDVIENLDWLTGLSKPRQLLELAASQSDYALNTLIDSWLDSRDVSQKRLVNLHTSYKIINYLPVSPQGLESTELSEYAREQFLETHNLDAWPYNVFKDPAQPLRQEVIRLYGDQSFRALWEDQQFSLAEQGYKKATPADRAVQLTDDLVLDIYSKDIESPEQKNALVSQVRQAIVTGEYAPNMVIFPVSDLIEEARRYSGVSHFFDQEKKTVFAIYNAQPEEVIGRLSSILEFHRRLLPTEQVQEVEKMVYQLRRDLHTRFTRGIGKRGYKVFVSDPFLKGKGYQQMLFRHQPGTDNIQVELSIDEEKFNFDMDLDFRIVAGKDIKRFASVQDQVWLEIMVLNHLKPLLCTEQSRFEDTLLDKKRQVHILNRQQFDRVEHLRHLSPSYFKPSIGKEIHPGWTERADKLCQESDLLIKQEDKNLTRINKIKEELGEGGTPETGLWTFVPAIHSIDMAILSKPIALSFAGAATSEMRSVLRLEEVSPEEYSRIRREIMARLEREFAAA